MRFNYFIIVLIGLSVIGCSEEEPDFFTDGRFIKFKFNGTDENFYKQSYNFSLGAETATEHEYTFPIEMMGRNLEQNMYFGVETDLEKTTLPNDCYNVSTSQIFRSGIGQVDSVRIKLFRKPILQQGEKVLRLKLVNSADFRIFTPDSAFIELAVQDVFVRPLWWDETVVNAYLGKYSRRKYDDFIRLTGAYDFASMDPSQKRHYAIMFKRDLEKFPRKDDVDGDGVDDEDMTVTIPG